MNHLQSSWKGLGLNPKLFVGLLRYGTLDEYATDSARTVLIAQIRERTFGWGLL